MVKPQKKALTSTGARKSKDTLEVKEISKRKKTASDAAVKSIKLGNSSSSSKKNVGGSQDVSRAISIFQSGMRNHLNTLYYSGTEFKFIASTIEDLINLCVQMNRDNCQENSALVSRCSAEILKSQRDTFRRSKSNRHESINKILKDMDMDEHSSVVEICSAVLGTLLAKINNGYWTSSSWVDYLFDTVCLYLAKHQPDKFKEFMLEDLVLKKSYRKEFKKGSDVDKFEIKAVLSYIEKEQKKLDTKLETDSSIKRSTDEAIENSDDSEVEKEIKVVPRKKPEIQKDNHKRKSTDSADEVIQSQTDKPKSTGSKSTAQKKSKINQVESELEALTHTKKSVPSKVDSQKETIRKLEVQLKKAKILAQLAEVTEATDPESEKQTDEEELSDSQQPESDKEAEDPDKSEKIDQFLVTKLLAKVTLKDFNRISKYDFKDNQYKYLQEYHDCKINKDKFNNKTVNGKDLTAHTKKNIRKTVDWWFERTDLTNTEKTV